MKTFIVFSFCFLFVASFFGCGGNRFGDDPVTDDGSKTFVIDTQGDTKKPTEEKPEAKKDEPKADEPKPTTPAVSQTNNQTQTGGNVNVTVTIVDGNGNKIGETTGAGEVVVIPPTEEKPPIEKPKEEPVVKPEEKPVDKPEVVVPKNPELFWTSGLKDGNLVATLGMKNPGNVKWSKLVVNFDYSLIALEIVDPSASWKEAGSDSLLDLIKVANKKGQLELTVERVGEGEQICSFSFSFVGKGKSLIGLSAYTSFYKTKEDMQNSANKVPIPFPKPIEVLKE
ncbi:MAG: hypothetical protein NTV62_04360 [Candidatus Gribaldobacteria bacterium]|nr:hypothetical protein [Candidatus Gribaldobacteria bacterium]